MADRVIQHRRLQNILLIQKLLMLREGSSPFTLLLDSVEQSAKPLIRHYIQNAKISKIDVVFLSFETLKPSSGIEVIIKGRRKSPAAIQKEILGACAKSKSGTLLVIDTLHPLARLSTATFNLSTFLSSFLSPQISLLAIYHVDIPIPAVSSYAPHPLTLLKYLATTVLTTHSFPQTLARKRAVDKSLSEPVFGIAEEREGVILGVGANEPQDMVLEMEYRRKSGRSVVEWFHLPLGAEVQETMAKRSGFVKVNGRNGLKPIILEDHPLWQAHAPRTGEELGSDAISTFELGLTAKQRKDREGVVLPYFDAQKGEGGEGGRILYEMGVEDDFDEEEDEI